ncbi:MAG TPA: S8 family serine peptidase [Bacteroidia bacterium]
MNKLLTLLTFSILLIHFSAHSQRNCKLNYGAAIVASSISQQENTIMLLVKGSVPQVKKLVENWGGVYHYSIENISSISIKGKYIDLLAEKRFIERIEAKDPCSKLQPMHDSMLVNNRVVAVHAGVSPLAQAYTGKGVVIGIIDTGIDYSHPDFKDSTGKSRIKFLWDQTLSDSVPPQPFNYGREWTHTDIDNGKASAHLSSTATFSGGHGTHVASEAAGNGLAIKKYKGVAPDADIIFVAENFGNPNGIVDATNYIYTKAALLGEPCSINCSLGDYFGSHDGTDLQAQAIKALITAQAGRSFSAAAGNCGNCIMHVGYTVSNSATHFTWFQNVSGTSFSVYADTNSFKNVYFAVGADQPSPYSFRGNIPFSTITSHLGMLKHDTLYYGNNRLGIIQSYGDLSNGVYSMQYSITPDSTSYNWRFMTTGSGKFDAWSNDVITANLADTSTYPPLKKYIQPDSLENIVSSFQCLNEVIAVGNYYNRNQHLDYDSVMQKNTAIIPGSLHPSSSHGPTRDGRIKPDISAPGNYMVGAVVLSLVNTFPHSQLAKGGYHRLGSGTSASAPTVAGIAALYLQQDPTADWLTIKNAIINCARRDTFTGINLPNNFWGYGKADAFNALTGCATLTNSYQTGTSEEFSLFPNPLISGSNLYFRFSDKTANPQIRICDMVGKEIKSVILEKTNSQFILNTENFNCGVYICTLKDGEKIVAVRKLVVTK